MGDDKNGLTGGRAGELNIVTRRYRKHTRMSVFLPGSFSAPSANRSEMSGHVTNISLGGVGIQLQEVHGIHSGAVGKLNFSITSPKEKMFHPEVIVRYVSGRRIGCEFVDKLSVSSELRQFMSYGVRTL